MLSLKKVYSVRRRQCRTSGRLTAKSVSIQGAKCRSGDRAWMAAEITPGDLSCVRNGLRLSRGSLTAGQKSAEGVLGHVVGKASEALRKPKGESTDRPSRERWSKARTRGAVSRT
jgi:hypothetical protein